MDGMCYRYSVCVVDGGMEGVTGIVCVWWMDGVTGIVCVWWMDGWKVLQV